MASGIITASANSVLDSLLGSGTPATYYAALMTVAPDAAGAGGTEASGTDYAREAVTNNATNFPAASARAKSNGTAIDFGTAGGAWGTIVGVALFDASSGGNMVFYGDLGTSQPVVLGNPVSIAIGALTFTLPFTA